MYIRWKGRASTSVDPTTRLRERRGGRRGNPGSVSHYAYLVHSMRVDGKPRQRVIAYLGSITTGRSDYAARDVSNPAVRYWFWRDVRVKLDAVPMDSAARASCETALAAVVPPLTDDDVAVYEAQLATFRAAHTP